MTKIYMNKVRGDSRWTFSFGTKNDLVDWKNEKKEWEANGFSCAEDVVKKLGDAKSIDEAIELINHAIYKETSNETK